MYLSAANQNTALDATRPARVRIDSVGIGVSSERNGQPQFIDLTPHYQFLAVGEQQANTFALAVDHLGVVVNSPFLDRSRPGNASAFHVDGNVRVTGALVAQSVFTYDGTPFVNTAGVWGVALPSLGAYYDNPVIIGGSNAALRNNNGLQILRDAFHDWNNAQLRIDNMAGAQVNVGFMGGAPNSPAIVQTPPGVAIEFHAGRDAAYFARHYIAPTLSGSTAYLGTPRYAPGDPRSEYPHMVIDVLGNVGVHTSAPAAYVTHTYSNRPPYTVLSETEPAALDVRGVLFASNILMYDYVTNGPQEINSMFFRRDGIIVSASNVGSSAFMDAPFSFPGNLAVGTSNDTRFSLNIGSSAQVEDTLYVRNLVKTENLEAVSSTLTTADVLNDIRVRQRLFVDAGIYQHVITSNTVIFASSNIALSFFGSNNVWFEANGALGAAASRSALGCNVVSLPEIATYDGLFYPGGSYVEDNARKCWTDAGGNVIGARILASNVSAGTNSYADPSGNAYAAPSPVFWAANGMWPPNVEIFRPSLLATLSSNVIVSSYAAINFSVASQGLCNVNYNGTGFNTPGRFGCGITGSDVVANQLVANKRDASIFELEVTDESDPYQRIKRSLLVGHRNFDALTNPSDYGATLFVTPSKDDVRYVSPSLAHNSTFAQHMYFLPGYDFLHKNIETDGGLAPALVLLGDGTNRIGVGTRAPQAALHVEGDTYVSGTMRDAVAPIAPFHAIQYTTSTGQEQTAATFRTGQLNGDVKRMSIFAAPDERAGLSVGTGLMADRYLTSDGFRMGEILLYTGDPQQPAFKGSNLFTMHSLAVGSAQPNPAYALEVVSANDAKTRMRVSRNGASADVSMELFVSEYDQWSLNGNSFGGKLTLANIGSSVPSARANLAALTAVYSNNRYHVGINTTTVYHDGEPVLLVNGNTTIVGDLNVTGIYCQNGKIVIDATSNAASTPGLSTAVTLGDEDVFVGGKDVYINPRGSLNVGAQISPGVNADAAVLRVYTQAPDAQASVPLAQFITDAPVGHLELVVSGSARSLRMEYSSDNTFRILSSDNASLPYLTLRTRTYVDMQYQNMTFNNRDSAIGTVIQMHDTTGGTYNALMLSTPSEGGGNGPKLSLAKVLGSTMSSQWLVQGPSQAFHDKLAFSYNASEAEMLTLTNDARVGIGATTPTFGVDLRGPTAARATLSATATVASVPATLRLATPEATYAFEASADSMLLQRTDNVNSARTVTIAHIGSNGAVSIGADKAPDAGYALTVAGKVNVTEGIYLNHTPLFSINDINYVNSSGLQYFVPGYGGTDTGLLPGGHYVGVSPSMLTSNLFYVSNHYDGATAVFESDTPDAHINLYAKPAFGAYGSVPETVARVGTSNSSIYLALRGDVPQSTTLFVDPSPQGFTTLATFASSGSTVHGTLTTTGAAVMPSLSVGTSGSGFGDAAPLQVAGDASGNALRVVGGGLAMRSDAGQWRGLDVGVDANGVSTFAAGGSNVLALASNEVRSIAPLRCMAGAAIDDISPCASNNVTVRDLNIVGSLTVNGIPFTDGFSEFTAGGAKYVVGLRGSIDSVTWQEGTSITIGTTPADVPKDSSPLTIAGQGTVPSSPGDIVRLAWAGVGGAPSATAALALGRNGSTGTRLDVRAGPSGTPALTVVTDASGASRIGVGGIVAPRFALDVSGDINVSGSFFQTAENININNAVLITPGSLSLSDHNVLIDSHYCGIGTATADATVPNMPLDVHNNVGGQQLARFITSNASGALLMVAGDGGRTSRATITVDANGLSLDTSGGITLSSSGASPSLQMQLKPSGAIRFAGSNMLAFDASGGATLLGYRFLASTTAQNGSQLTLSSPTNPQHPFIYFFGESGGVGIGTASYPFSVLNISVWDTPSRVNGEPLRLLVNGAISCTAISSFTGQHIVVLSHPTFKDDYAGLLVSLTGRVVDNTYSLVQSTPIVEFARTRMDKAAYGVLSSREGGEAHAWVCIVNSVGEGAMWVCNVNGDVALGDYITTSSVAGYGMRQADDVLHSYTVAKASTGVTFGQPPGWIKTRKFNFTEPYDREIKCVTACLIPVTYHCA